MPETGASPMGATLRVVYADDTAADDPRFFTLQQIFDERMRKTLERGKRATGTIKDYQTSLRHWGALSPDPQLCEITDEDLEAFADALESRPEIETLTTVDKHVKNIESILRFCGPKTRQHPSALKAIESPPFIARRSGSQAAGEHRVISVDEMNAIYRACSVARWPNAAVPAPVVWRAFFVFLWNVGPSRTQAFLFPTKAVHFSAECPVGRFRNITNEHGWLSFVREKTKRTKPQPITLPMCETLSRHVRSVHNRDRERLFPFSKCQRDWYRWMYEIQAAAGLEKPFTPQEFRVTCNVEWDEVQFGIGASVLGHDRRDVNSRHYKAVVKRLAALVQERAQPSAFNDPEFQF